MAKVTSVSYGRLATFGRFENEKVSITLELEPGDTADSALAQAIGWVEDKLALRNHLDESIREKQQEVARLQTLGTELDSVIVRARKVIEMLQPAPVGTPEHHDDDDDHSTGPTDLERLKLREQLNQERGIDI
jgi:hypothetical protein